MEWPLALLLILGTLVLLMTTGMPVAFCFLLTCFIGVLVFWGGAAGLEMLVTGIFSAIASFAFVPLALFILMGTVIFESGVGFLMVDALDRILGHLPGRLALIAVGGGTLLATMTGVSAGSVAILGKGLLPDMERRGYQKTMTLGPIVGSGCLAALIPPSALAIFLGAIGKISIGKLLIAIILPGLLMAVLFAAYIIIRCTLQPYLAPSYTVSHISLSEKFSLTVRHILPVGIVIFAVIGVILLGIATPSEAAALGTVACYLLAALHGKLNWQMVRKSALSAIETTIMIFMIIAGAVSFARILSYSGAIKGLIDLSIGLPVDPILIIIASQAVVVFMGMFMEPAGIILITMPIYVPVVATLNFDLVWFGVLMLINVQLGLISPPFGSDCYIMKGVAPPGVTVGDVFGSAMPFLILGLLAMAIIIAFPQVALWLPGMIG